MSNYRKKLFNLLADLGGNPIAQATAVDFVASALNLTPQLVRRQAKAAKAAKVAAEQSSEGPNLNASIDGIFYSPPDIYYVKSGVRNEFEPRRERDVDLMLIERGLSPKKSPVDNLSDVQRARLLIQNQHSVSYAGPQTAFPVGLHQHGETSFLVTRQPNFVEARQGDPGPFLELTRHLCGVGQDDHGEAQLTTVLGWFRQWLRAQEDPKTFVQGQILAVGGSPGIGKNRYAFFMGKIGGDRVYEPSRNSNFNAELIGSTLEVSHDASFPDDSTEIREYWLKRKALVANHEHRVEKKYADARTMPLAAVRCMVTFNLGEESSKILQPMLLEEGMADKIILLRGYGPPTPYPQQGTPEGKEWQSRVLASLPAFIWYVKNEFVLPDSMKDQRYGVATWHHPQIVSLVQNSHPDSPLGEAIDSWFAARHSSFPGPWEGTATDLHNELRLTNGATFSAISKSPQHLGHQLPRLKSRPGWSDRLSSRTIWVGVSANQERKLWRLLPSA